MRKLTRVLAVLPLLVAACTATTTPAYLWTKTDASPEDLERAKRACTDRAAAATATLHNDSTATRAALDVFLKCMDANGWKQIPQNQHE